MLTQKIIFSQSLGLVRSLQILRIFMKIKIYYLGFLLVSKE